MADKLLSPGDVLLVNLSSHVPRGFEQEGERPVAVVGVPFGKQRFPVIVVVPATTSTGVWAKQNPLLYPRLTAGNGGLNKESWLLLDQIRSLDPERIIGYLGTLQDIDYEKIKSGIKALLAI
jgi:mRNA interferase MazF